LFKKVVIADRIAVIVSQVYGDLRSYSGVPLMITAVLYTFQIYFDFSGYSDIAIGSGQILGFDLPENFNKPLLSGSITEFWRRWHITLSTWLRDYLFMPISIAVRDWGKYSVAFALLVTFFLAGMWHGAGWTFIIFGMLHGIALTYEALSRRFRKNLSRKLPQSFYNPFCVVVAFSYVTLAFIFFRAVTVSDALYFLSHLFYNINFRYASYNLGLGKFETILTVVLIASLMLIEIFSEEDVIRLISGKLAIVRWSAYYLVILMILLFGEFGATNFIYFKF